MRKVFCILFISILSFIVAHSTQAAGASLYLSPASGSFFVGGTFDVSVFINTGGENVNAVEINLKFDPQKIQVASPTAGKSFIEVWVSQPTYSNTKGTLSFIGGVPTPGINTSAGLVSTVTFRAITPGRTEISFLVSTKVLRNDPDGTDILTSKSRGVYEFLIPPPEGPRVFSPTHPDQNKWHKNNNPAFSWETEEKVTDFSYSFDQDPNGAPDNTSEGSHTSVSYSEVGDGIWYFHVKAEKENVWGGTSNFPIQIDSTPPAAFTPTVEPSSKTTENQPLISFITTDALSGLDYCQIKYIDITPEKKEEETGFFREATSPYKLPSLEVGKYLVVVRANDKAGNWREGTIKIQIFPKGVLITKKGIQYQEWIFPWWLLILILIIILLIIAFNLWRKQKSLKEEKEVKEVKIRLQSHQKNHQKKILDGIKRY